ncbi:MAG: hypothetical protein OEZ02_14135, partial [Anaerolineae bacterium]|nr:hypothetical protein [Anaerolineae bacterium]
MPLDAAVGRAFALTGRDAGTHAVHEAISQLRGPAISLGFVIASHSFNIQDVMNGVSAQLGNTPLLGFSSSGEIAGDESNTRSVSVALLAGDGFQSQAEWLPGFSDDGVQTTQNILQTLQLERQTKPNLILVADGINGDGQHLCDALPGGDYAMAGWLAGGDLRMGRTYQIGGGQAGSGGLSAAMFTGDIRMGVGMAHGWQLAGPSFQVTQARGPWLRTLDEQPASESYARMFGHEAREWAFPPLNTLVRLYPLGLGSENGEDLQLRSPIRVEADGSLRMNTDIPDGGVAHLYVGSQEKCMTAAAEATRQALSQLGDARPVLALVLAD